MKIKDVDKVCIVDIAGKTISESDLIELKELYKKTSSKKRIGLNLEHVVSIDANFLEFIKETSQKQKLSAFCLNNEAYLMLFISRYDHHINIYINENDFYQDKRSIVYRRLKLLKTA